MSKCTAEWAHRVNPELFQDNRDRGAIFVYEGEAFANINFKSYKWSVPPTDEHYEAVFELLDRP